MLLIAALIPMAMIASWESSAPQKHPAHPEMTKAAPIRALFDPDRDNFLKASRGLGEQYLLNGGFEPWTRKRTRTNSVSNYWESLLEEWRSNLPDKPGYAWAETYGEGTQVIEVLLGWEEQHAEDLSEWNKRQRTIYFTSTPTFDFGSTSYTYRDSIRIVREAKHEAFAKLFIESADLQPGVAQALSMNCRLDDKIRSLLISDNFFERKSGAAKADSATGPNFTTIPTILISQLLAFGSTDFELEYESGSNMMRHRSLEMDSHHRALPFHRFKGRRNLIVSARITGRGSTLAIPKVSMTTQSGESREL